MSKYKSVKCDSWEVPVVNNVICHETDCPAAWKDEVRYCKWCGTRFKPWNSYQEFCDLDYAEAYNS